VAEERTSDEFSWARFEAMPIVGILRGFTSRQTLLAIEAAARGGITTVEVTLDTDGAEAMIAALRERFDGALHVGAGTVRSTGDLDGALRAGAQFIVTPVVLPDVIRAAGERGVPIFAGALTPSEIHTAWSLGADLVKVFPANLFGPSYIRDLRGPLRGARLMPTGGVTVETIGEYRRAGAEAFGLGSPLFARERVEAADFEWIEEQAKRFVALLRGDEATSRGAPPAG